MKIDNVSWIANGQQPSCIGENQPPNDVLHLNGSPQQDSTSDEKRAVVGQLELTALMKVNSSKH